QYEISVKSAGNSASATISPTGASGSVSGTFGYCAPTFGGDGGGGGGGGGGVTTGGGGDDDGGQGPTFTESAGGGGGGICSGSFQILACAAGSEINACVGVAGTFGPGGASATSNMI